MEVWCECEPGDYDCVCICVFVFSFVCLFRLSTGSMCLCVCVCLCMLLRLSSEKKFTGCLYVRVILCLFDILYKISEKGKVNELLQQVVK